MVGEEVGAAANGADSAAYYPSHYMMGSANGPGMMAGDEGWSNETQHAMQWGLYGNQEFDHSSYQGSAEIMARAADARATSPNMAGVAPVARSAAEATPVDMALVGAVSSALARLGVCGGNVPGGGCCGAQFGNMDVASITAAVAAACMTQSSVGAGNAWPAAQASPPNFSVGGAGQQNMPFSHQQAHHEAQLNAWMQSSAAHAPSASAHVPFTTGQAPWGTDPAAQAIPPSIGSTPESQAPSIGNNWQQSAYHSVTANPGYPAPRLSGETQSPALPAPHMSPTLSACTKASLMNPTPTTAPPAEPPFNLADGEKAPDETAAYESQLTSAVADFLSGHCLDEESGESGDEADEEVAAQLAALPNQAPDSDANVSAASALAAGAPPFHPAGMALKAESTTMVEPTYTEEVPTPTVDIESSIKRGKFLLMSLAKMPLPASLPETRFPSLCHLICNCLKDLYNSQAVPTVAALQKSLRDNKLEEEVVSAVLPLCARMPDHFLFWLPSDGKVCVLLRNEPIFNANIQGATFDGPYSKAFLLALEEKVNTLLSGAVASATDGIRAGGAASQRTPSATQLLPPGLACGGSACAGSGAVSSNISLTTALNSGAGWPAPFSSPATVPRASAAHQGVCAATAPIAPPAAAVTSAVTAFNTLPLGLGTVNSLTPAANPSNVQAVINAQSMPQPCRQCMTPSPAVGSFAFRGLPEGPHPAPVGAIGQAAHACQANAPLATIPPIIGPSPGVPGPPPLSQLPEMAQGAMRPLCKGGDADKPVVRTGSGGPCPISNGAPASLADALQKQAVTTLMLRNVPTLVSQKRLVEELEKGGFAGQYDFCYMPSTFGTGATKGYAFINFLTPEIVASFVRQWHGSRRFGVTGNEPALNVSAATLQGRDENIRKWDAPRMRRVRNPALRPLVREDQCPVTSASG